MGCSRQREHQGRGTLGAWRKNHAPFFAEINMLGSLVEGESRLFGFLGANLTLGGFRLAVEKANLGLQRFMPCLEHLLILAQIAVALATLVYMVLKIRKVWRKVKDDE